MSIAASRAVLRQQRLLVGRPAIRSASNASNAAGKTKEAASKTQENLTKVANSAGPVLQNFVKSLRSFGGPAAKIVSFFDSLVPPTVYYSKVGIELAKIVYKGQNMTPPSLTTFQSYLSPLLTPATLISRAYSFNPNAAITCLKNLDKKQWTFIGITSAETLGFFTVGEMIGRVKVVGYHGEVAHDH